MNTQTIIKNYLDFLDTKKLELVSFRNITNEYEKLRIFDNILEDFETLISQSSLAIKALQIDNYNLGEDVSTLKLENGNLIKKLEKVEKIGNKKAKVDSNNTKLEDINNNLPNKKQEYYSNKNQDLFNKHDYRDYKNDYTRDYKGSYFIYLSYR